MLAEIDITDAAEFEKYRVQVTAIVAAYGGRYLVCGSDQQGVDGSGEPSRVGALEFDGPECEE